MSSALKQRRPQTAAAASTQAATSLDDTSEAGHSSPDDKQAQPALGKTPDGQVFRIPQTHNVLSGLFDPRLPKSTFDYLILGTLLSQLLLFATLPLAVSRLFFMLYFAFWRLSYNGGLGVVLRKQSETRWIVRTARPYFDASLHPKAAAWLKSQLQVRMGSDYDFEVRSIPVAVALLWY